MERIGRPSLKNWSRPLRAMDELLDDLLADLVPGPPGTDPDVAPDTSGT